MTSRAAGRSGGRGGGGRAYTYDRTAPSRMTIGFSHGYEFLDALLASLADAVYFVGPAGEVRFANPAARGAARLRVRGRAAGPPEPRDDPLAPAGRRAVPERECPLLRAARDGRDGARRARLVRPPRRFDGAGRLRVAPLEMPDGRGAVVVFRDLTERLDADEVAASRARIVAATDAERRRIGRDLHDGAQQRLVRALMGIEEARRAPERAEDALARAAADARHAIDDLRELANGLHPLVLTDRGLAAALEELTAGAPVAGRAARSRRSASRRRSRRARTSSSPRR